jgi:hypothetical protein
LRAYRKTSAQLADNDKRQPNFIGLLDLIDNRGIAAAEVGIAVCIKR